MTGLQEGKPYKFRVKAVNKEGESEELETEKSIIAKNPFGENNDDVLLLFCVINSNFFLKFSYLDLIVVLILYK